FSSNASIRRAPGAPSVTVAAPPAGTSCRRCACGGSRTQPTPGTCTVFSTSRSKTMRARTAQRSWRASTLMAIGVVRPAAGADSPDGRTNRRAVVDRDLERARGDLRRAARHARDLETRARAGAARLRGDDRARGALGDDRRVRAFGERLAGDDARAEIAARR